MVIQPLKRSSGNYVRNGGFALAIAGSRVRNKPCQRPDPPNVDSFSHNRLSSPFFTQWVCTLVATPPQTTPAPPPIGGNCTTRGFDTPATRRQRASCSAKPPSHQIGDRTVRNSRRCGGGIVRARFLPKVPPQVASSPRRLPPRRRQSHLSTNFACNSPTVRIDASLKTAEFQRSDFNI